MSLPNDFPESVPVTESESGCELGLLEILQEERSFSRAGLPRKFLVSFTPRPRYSRTLCTHTVAELVVGVMQLLVVVQNGERERIAAQLEKRKPESSPRLSKFTSSLMFTYSRSGCFETDDKWVDQHRHQITGRCIGNHRIGIFVGKRMGGLGPPSSMSIEPYHSLIETEMCLGAAPSVGCARTGMCFDISPISARGGWYPRPSIYERASLVDFLGDLSTPFPVHGKIKVIKKDISKLDGQPVHIQIRSCSQGWVSCPCQR